MEWKCDVTEYKDCLTRENDMDFVRLYAVLMRVLGVRWPILVHHHKRLLNPTTHVNLLLLKKVRRVDVYDVGAEARLEA